MTTSKKAISLCAVVLISAVSTSVSAKKPEKLEYHKTEFSTEQDVTGKLLYLNETDGNTSLLIHNKKNFIYYPALVGANLAKEEQVIAIPKQVQFYNKGKLANVEQDVLFYLSGEKVFSYNFLEKSVTEQFTIDSLNHYQTEFQTEYSEFIIDINNDGLTDIITYSLDKTHLYIQDSSANFTHQILNLAPKVNSSSNSVTFSPYPFYNIDTNGDKKSDIAFQVNDQLLSFVQKNDGSFKADADIIKLNAGILSHLEYETLQDGSADDIARISVESIEDLNNDGIVDLVTKEKVRTGMISFENELVIRFGNICSGILTFKPSPNGKAVFKGEGDLFFKDINNDGLKDYYSRGVEIGFGMIMSVMSGSVDVELNFYLMESDQSYSKKPIFSSEMEVEVNDDDDNSGFGLNSIEDFNGDGKLDLALQTDKDEFKLYFGGGKKVFNKRGQSYDIGLPVKGRTEVKDFNNDGKADILMLHGEKFDDDNKVVGQKKISLWLSKS